MQVAINTSRRVNKDGLEVVYESALVRRTYREGGKVKHETLGNVSFPTRQSPAKNVAKELPFVGVLIGTGMGSAILGKAAADEQKYCQTRYLCEKYGLTLPAALTTDPDDDSHADAA